jgi:hypothetical protein
MREIKEQNPEVQASLDCGASLEGGNEGGWFLNFTQDFSCFFIKGSYLRAPG